MIELAPASNPHTERLRELIDRVVLLMDARGGFTPDARDALARMWKLHDHVIDCTEQDGYVTVEQRADFHDEAFELYEIALGSVPRERWRLVS